MGDLWGPPTRGVGPMVSGRVIRLPHPAHRSVELEPRHPTEPDGRVLDVGLLPRHRAGTRGADGTLVDPAWEAGVLREPTHHLAHLDRFSSRDVEDDASRACRADRAGDGPGHVPHVDEVSERLEGTELHRGGAGSDGLLD